MNNLIDTVLSKVEYIASRPSRAMAIADALLDRFAPKDVASAEQFYEYQLGPCTPSPTCSPIKAFRSTKRRLCNCHYAGCCGAWVNLGMTCRC